MDSKLHLWSLLKGYSDLWNPRPVRVFKLRSAFSTHGEPLLGPHTDALCNERLCNTLLREVLKRSATRGTVMRRSTDLLSLRSVPCRCVFFVLQRLFSEKFSAGPLWTTLSAHWEFKFLKVWWENEDQTNFLKFTVLTQRPQQLHSPRQIDRAIELRPSTSKSPLGPLWERTKFKFSKRSPWSVSRSRSRGGTTGTDCALLHT